MPVTGVGTLTQRIREGYLNLLLERRPKEVEEMDRAGTLLDHLEKTVESYEIDIGITMTKAMRESQALENYFDQVRFLNGAKSEAIAQVFSDMDGLVTPEAEDGAET